MTGRSLDFPQTCNTTFFSSGAVSGAASGAAAGTASFFSSALSSPVEGGCWLIDSTASYPRKPDALKGGEKVSEKLRMPKWN